MVMSEDIQKKKKSEDSVQRLLPKYNSPTHLRLKLKVAAKNVEDLIAKDVETKNDLTEINHKSYPFLPRYRKES